MAVFKFRFVWLVVVAAAALMFGAGWLAPRTASAAGVNIDPTSCGGAGYPNCTSLPANVTIGANSCTVAGACDKLGDGVVIGANSCNATDACDYASGSVGDNSCNRGEACRYNGYGGTGSVGDNSCNGDAACYENGYGGTGSVGDNSCDKNYACYTNGNYGTGIIGDYSCNGTSACWYTGDGTTSTIGNISCNQSGTYDANCQYTHEDVGNCEYNDVPTLCTEGSIQVNKVVAGDSNARFNLKIDGVVQASAVGDGGTTGPLLVDPGTHSAGESAVYPARLSDYDQRTTCEAYNAIVGSHSHTIVPRTRGTAVFNVNAGDVVTCTITNTKLTGFFPFRR